tara:strand:+ start:749 stop:970 length:222 start_codon:yes stop_codon:yes gene_type:complete
MKTEGLTRSAAKYELLKMEITGTLKAYNNLLKDYEQDLKRYIIEDYDEVLLDVQQKLIIKLKAKIEVLTDLNK